MENKNNNNNKTIPVEYSYVYCFREVKENKLKMIMESQLIEQYRWLYKARFIFC